MLSRKLLRRIRANCGLSQEQLAQELGVSAKTIYRWERGESSLSSDSFKSLARFLYPRSASILPPSVYSEFCELRRNAADLVRRAIKKGELVKLSTGDVGCADCGSAATQYDHRDYTKPLSVDAVCQSCNFRRGIALATLPRIWKV